MTVEVEKIVLGKTCRCAASVAVTVEVAEAEASTTRMRATAPVIVEVEEIDATSRLVVEEIEALAFEVATIEAVSGRSRVIALDTVEVEEMLAGWRGFRTATAAVMSEEAEIVEETDTRLARLALMSEVALRDAESGFST